MRSSVPASRALVVPVLKGLRSRSRWVYLPDADGNLGNFLYHWLGAWRQRMAGRQAVVRSTPVMGPWRAMWPTLSAEILIEPDQVRFTDNRVIGGLQAWGAEYFPAHVESFATRLAAEGIGPVPLPALDPGRVVVNIRRGDFYSTYAARYAFDLPTYLAVAVERSLALGGPIERVHVVSDDRHWCERELSDLPALRGAKLSFAAPDPQGNLTDLAQARRLILTNSTFGYWGAHISNAVHGDNHEQVVVPWFHDRSTWDGAAYQLNPAWSMVRHIPGGWGPPDPAH